MTLLSISLKESNPTLLEAIKNWNINHAYYKIDINEKKPWLLDANFARIQPLNPDRIIEQANQIVEMQRKIQEKKELCADICLGNWVNIYPDNKPYVYSGKVIVKNDFAIQIKTGISEYHIALFTMEWGIAVRERLGDEVY